MKDIIIYGSGGMAREVVELIEDINNIKPCWTIKGYIDDDAEKKGEIIHGYSILGTCEVLCKLSRPVSVIIAVGDPTAKKKIYQKIENPAVMFPILIHPSARVSKSAVIGEGSIIGIDCIISANVRLGRHVFLNMRTVVGHDAVINDFCSCLVNCVIAGGVQMLECSLLGSGSIIMEKTTVGSGARISMGSIVSFDVEDNHVVMTRPSKSMYFGKAALNKEEIDLPNKGGTD